MRVCVRLEWTACVWCYTGNLAPHTEGANLDKLPEGCHVWKGARMLWNGGEVEELEREGGLFSRDDAVREEIRASEREWVKVRE